MRYIMSRLYSITVRTRYGDKEHETLEYQSFVCADSKQEALDGYTNGNGMEDGNMIWYKIEIISHGAGVSINEEQFKDLKQQNK